MNIDCDINMQASITEILKPKWTPVIVVRASAWDRPLDFYDLFHSSFQLSDAVWIRVLTLEKYSDLTLKSSVRVSHHPWWVAAINS